MSSFHKTDDFGITDSIVVYGKKHKRTGLKSRKFDGKIEQE